MDIIKSAFRTVFKDRFYVVMTSVIAVILFIVSAWLSNLKLIFTVFSVTEATFTDKINVLIGLAGSIGTNFTLFAASYTAIIAILFAINVSMLAFFMKRNKEFGGQSGAVSLGGLTSGVFGVGCAACGTLVVGPLLAFFGAAGIVYYLPFDGQEFGVLSIFILSLSIYLIAKKIAKPAVCMAKKDEETFIN